MKNLYTLLLVGLSQFAFSQYPEKIIYDPEDPRVFDGVRLGKKILFMQSSCLQVWGNCTTTKIFLMDEDLNILDSLDLVDRWGVGGITANELQVTGPNRVAFPLSEYLPVGNTHLLHLDSNLAIVDSLTISGHTDLFWPIFYSEVQDKIVLAGGVNIKPYLVVLNAAGQRLYSDSLEIAGSYNNAMAFNNHILMGAEFRGAEQFVVLDSAYQVDSIPEKTAPLWMDMNVYDFIPSAADSDKNIYALARIYGDPPALLKLDENFQIVRWDSIATSEGRAHFPVGAYDLSNPDSMYVITGQDPILFRWEFQPGESRKIIVTNLDTSAAVNFRVEISDGKYYAPQSIVRTSDGGAIIFSLKYDWDLQTLSQTVLSIIKIDNQGNVVSRKEMPYSGRLLRIFPNPATNEVQVAGLDENLSLQVRLFDMDGKPLLEESLGTSRSIDVSAINPGAYVLQLTNESGGVVSRKLVIE